MERRLTALVQRTLSTAPADSLRAVRELREELVWLEQRAVVQAHRADVGWATIARLLGRSRQAVWKQYAALDHPVPVRRREPQDAQSQCEQYLRLLRADLRREREAGDDDVVPW